VAEPTSDGVTNAVAGPVLGLPKLATEYIPRSVRSGIGAPALIGSVPLSVVEASEEGTMLFEGEAGDRCMEGGQA
jgi:hypothetical protein